jgi:hypothetical protein
MTDRTQTVTPQMIQEYLDWSYHQTQELAGRVQIHSRKPEVRAIDVPSSINTTEELRYFAQFIVGAGYNCFHVGLTQVWQSEKRRHDIQGLQEKLPLGAAHGTSIKLAIKSGVSYEEIIANDLAVMDLLDPARTVPVNYDLFFGNVFNGVFPLLYAEAAEKNVEQMGQLLKMETAQELDLIFKIVDAVLSVYSNNNRPIVFEIPGTKGWSLFPELTEQLLIHLIKRLELKKDTVGICIDLGHILTWAVQEEYLREISSLLMKYQSHIKMIHISSAGSRNALFQQAYNTYHGRVLPKWHVDGLDVMLPICEIEMTHILELIRSNFTRLPIEVCETRMAEAAVLDYLPNTNVSLISPHYRDLYYKALTYQSHILGYDYE